MDELLKRLAAQGYDCVPVFNGEYQRFDRNGKTLAGWFLGHTFTGPKGTILTADYGDWVTKERCEWRSDTAENYSKEDLEKLKSIVVELNKKRTAAKEAERAAAAQRAKDIWENAALSFPSPEHPYLKKKGVRSTELVRYSSAGDLIVPILNGPDKEIVSLQFISSEGEKKFLPGGRLKESYSWAGVRGTDNETVYICEGWATAQSIGMAINNSVLVAFNASNIPALSNRLPVNCKRVVICADNDQWTEGNPGLKAARQAQKCLAGKDIPCSIVYPPFDKTEEKLTDFNDLHKKYGLERVKEEIEKQSAAGFSEIAKWAGGQQFGLPSLQEYEPLPWKPDAKGKRQPPSQHEVTMALLDNLEGTCLREDKEVFVWLGTHWEEQKPFDFRCYIKKCAQRLMSCQAGEKLLNDIYSMFIGNLPSTRHSFYKQAPYLANFLDGTLEVKRGDNGTYSLDFRGHSPGDLLTWVLPYRYLDARGENQLFDSWLARCFEGDPDKDGKIRALAQIGGASIVSLFPRTVFLHGPAGTGKSTFAKLCLAFVGKDNYCGVEPQDQHSQSPLLATMINKQVNVVTDISDKKFDTAFLKRGEDRMYATINRKYRDPIKAALPALNIYCCNEMPKGVDAISEAFDRRITIVEFMRSITREGAYKREYEEIILSAGPGAILDFFIKGLEDLCQSGGIYYNPDSGKKALRVWKDKEDVVALFFEAIEEGEVGGPGSELYLDANARIKKSVFMNELKRFYDRPMAPATQKVLATNIERRGFKISPSNGIYYIYGIGVKGVDSGCSSEKSSGPGAVVAPHSTTGF